MTNATSSSPRSEPETALTVYQKQGLGGSLGFGKRCALLVIDFVNGFANPDVLGGGNIAESIEATARLLAICRAAAIPVVFTRMVYQSAQANNVFARKIPSIRALTEDNPDSAVVPQLEVAPDDLIVRKTQPSAFFGTDLAGHFTALGVDTILVAGCTTSGCVRASVVDAMSYNFIPIVVNECVGDRALAPHDANMFDMEQKYAELLSLDEVIQHIQSIKK